MIVVHIPYGEGTGNYVQYCISAMKRLASKPDEVEEMLHICPRHPKTPADNHCVAVGEAFRMTSVKPDAIHVICDSDTVVVMPHWDEVLKQQLQQWDCVGTAYQRVGTKQTGFGKKQTYKGKPNIEWLALAPHKPWHLFVPARTGQVEPIVTNTPELQELFGLPSNGYELLHDACWNFPLFLRDHQLTTLAWENVEAHVALDGCGGDYEEWHLPDGRPFVVHQGKSRKTPFRGTDRSRVFYDRCDVLTGLTLPGSS